MPRYRITYYRQYEIETHNENDAVGIIDQTFTEDIREVASSQGNGKIHQIFSFKVERIKRK